MGELVGGQVLRIMVSTIDGPKERRVSKKDDLSPTTMPYVIEDAYQLTKYATLRYPSPPPMAAESSRIGSWLLKGVICSSGSNADAEWHSKAVKWSRNNQART
jgi:hypothetical protein